MGHFDESGLEAAASRLTADGIDVGRVTGYYEPLLKGSRVRNDRYRYPLYAPPDDLLTVELGDIFPELKSERVRGRLDGKRVVPYWSRAEIDATLNLRRRPFRPTLNALRVLPLIYGHAIVLRAKGLRRR